MRLATVVAPAGYGKTTLLAQWEARDERPFAWVTLDKHDVDPLVLLRHLAAALDRVAPVEQRVLDALAGPAASVWATAAPWVASALAAAPDPFVLVLDAADAVAPGDAADVIAALAAQIPEGSMLALAGRTVCALPAARLRARGDLLELGLDDLALSRREAQLLVRGTGAEPSDDALAALVAESEGWAAGLALAARGGARASRRVADYLEAEALADVPPERLDFMRRTCVLERLSGPLCDAVLEGEGSASHLDALADASLFLVPLDLDGDWWRYHHRLRELLQRDLERREPALSAVLHARAAAWFEEAGDLASALDHAQAAGDAARAADLLTRIAVPSYAEGRLGAVDAWIRRFEASAPLEEHPGVAALAGWVAALLGRPDEAERALAAAERGDAGEAGPWVALLRAGLCADGVDRMEQDVRRALAALPDAGPWFAAALAVQGAAAVMSGDVGGADASFAAAAEAAERSGSPDTRAVALAERSLLALAAGEHAASERLALEARDVLAAAELGGYATGAIVGAAAARAFLRHGRWDEARAELKAAEERAVSLTHAIPWLAVRTRLALGAAYVTLRDREAACRTVAELERLVELRPQLGTLLDELAELRRHVAELPESEEGHTSGLTRAELRLLPLLATHLSFREIGDRLYVSRNTIKTQAISAYRKLGVSSRSTAIARAAELGLVEDRAAAPADFIREG